MEIPFTPPSFRGSSFNCPHCKAYSSMSWNDAYRGFQGRNSISALQSAHCEHCREYSLWIESEMIYPSELLVESPNSDLPEEIKADYFEAANILSKSPRGAAALLRLAIEKLVNFLDVDGKDLNSKIGNLVAQGLSSKIQQALDVVRVIGNEAVHPGQIDLNDDPVIAQTLFKLVNIISNEMITEPKEVSLLYDQLIPDSQKAGISKRDSE